MKRFLKSSLSLLLAITIIFSSAYIGLSEVNFTKLFEIKVNASNFADSQFNLNSLYNRNENFIKTIFLNKSADINFEPTSEKSLVSVEICSIPTKTIYYIGDSIIADGLELNVTYSDGSTNIVSTGFTLEYETSSIGSNTVTVFYEGFQDTFTVTVKQPSITLDSETKIIYVGYEDIIQATTTPSLQTITWTSSNTTVATVSNGTITPKKAGNTKITASFKYNNRTYYDTCLVTVEKEITSISISEPPIKKVYYIGEQFISDGLKLKVTYSDGTSEYISDDFSVSGFDSTTTGTQKVTINYEGFKTTFDVVVNTIPSSGYKVGDIIEFGEYPQSKVNDRDLVSSLNAIDMDWISYNYRLTRDGSQSDFMKYKDVTYNGEKYRAVTFSTYRPGYLTYYTNSGSQESNGYYTNVVYWFKYEPLYWRVIDPLSGLVLCENVVDAQEYTLKDKDYIDSGIRFWLNNNFYNTSFNAEDKQRIKTITHDNNTYHGNTPTTDTVFLLSIEEVMDLNHGFSTTYGMDFARTVRGTDYSASQGGSSNSCSWWLRTSGSHDRHYKHAVLPDGEIVGKESNVVGIGVRPALVLDIGVDSDKSLLGISISKTPDESIYYIGDDFDDSNIELELEYSDGSIEIITSGFTTNGFDSNSEGTKTVTVSYEGFTDTFTVTVETPSITLSSRNESITVGDSSTLIATTTPSGQTVTWTSSNTNIATVSNGIITAKSEGTATITAKFIYNGITYNKTCNVTVTVPVHLHTVSDWITDKNATCISLGSRHKECTTCGETIETESISKTNHSYSSSWTIDVEATCTYEGSKSHHCTYCDVKTDVTAILPLGHHFGAWETVTAATCTEQGQKVRYCVNCNSSEYEVIEATGHEYSKTWTLDVEPTCTSNGSKSRHCVNCDAKTEVTVVNPKPHKFSEWETVKKPTYTSYGQEVSYCDVCYSTEYKVIPKLICAAPKLKKVSNTTNGVKITWGKVTGAESYVVLRKTGSGSWKKIAEDVTSTSYTDKTAKAGKNYKYTVRAKSDGGLSKYNTTGLSIKRLTTPKLKNVTTAKAGVTFKWNKVTGASGYIVYRKTGNGSWKKIATVKGNAKVTYLDKKAKKGTTYKYTVKAYYGSTFSAYNTKGLKIKDKY